MAMPGLSGYHPGIAPVVEEPAPKLLSYGNRKSRFYNTNSQKDNLQSSSALVPPVVSRKSAEKFLKTLRRRSKSASRSNLQLGKELRGSDGSLNKYCLSRPDEEPQQHQKKSNNLISDKKSEKVTLVGFSSHCELDQQRHHYNRNSATLVTPTFALRRPISTSTLDDSFISSESNNNNNNNNNSNNKQRTHRGRYRARGRKGGNFDFGGSCYNLNLEQQPGNFSTLKTSREVKMERERLRAQERLLSGKTSILMDGSKSPLLGLAGAASSTMSSTESSLETRQRFFEEARQRFRNGGGGGGTRSFDEGDFFAQFVSQNQERFAQLVKEQQQQRMRIAQGTGGGVAGTSPNAEKAKEEASLRETVAIRSSKGEQEKAAAKSTSIPVVIVQERNYTAAKKVHHIKIQREGENEANNNSEDIKKDEKSSSIVFRSSSTSSRLSSSSSGFSSIEGRQQQHQQSSSSSQQQQHIHQKTLSTASSGFSSIEGQQQQQQPQQRNLSTSSKISTSSSSGFSSIEGKQQQQQQKSAFYHPTFSNHLAFGRSGTGLRPSSVKSSYSSSSDNSENSERRNRNRRMSEHNEQQQQQQQQHEKSVKSSSVDYGVVMADIKQETAVQNEDEEEENENGSKLNFRYSVTATLTTTAGGTTTTSAKATFCDSESDSETEDDDDVNEDLNDEEDEEEEEDLDSVSIVAARGRSNRSTASSSAASTLPRSLTTSANKDEEETFEDDDEYDLETNSKPRTDSSSSAKGETDSGRGESPDTKSNNNNHHLLRLNNKQINSSTSSSSGSSLGIRGRNRGRKAQRPISAVPSEFSDVSTGSSRSAVSTSSSNIDLDKEDPRLLHSAAPEKASSSSDQEDVKETEEERVKRLDLIFRIASELLTTEEEYVRILHLIDQVFHFRVDQENRAHHLFPPETLPQMFANIKSIYKFHAEFLLPHLRERMSQWHLGVEHQRIGDIIVKFSPFFKMYTEYVKNFDNAITTINNLYQKNARFQALMDDIHALPECRSLSLQHHMLTPIQRIPRYEMLLKDYLKKLSNDSLDRQDSEKALHLVSTAAAHANEAMRRIEKFKQLLEVQESLGGCVDLISPTRELVKEGKMVKISARSGDHQDRYVFLFSDVFLLCSTRLITNRVISGSGPAYRLRARFEVENMQILEGDNLVTANTFYIRDDHKSVELYTQTREEKEAWLECLYNTIKELYQRKSSLRLGIRGRDLLRPLEAEIGVKTPRLLRLDAIAKCMECGQPFTMMRKKHNCRACGIVVCTKCSGQKYPLNFEDGKFCRVCRACHKQLLLNDKSRRNSEADSEDNILKLGGGQQTSPSFNALRTKGLLEVSASSPSIISGFLVLKSAQLTSSSGNQTHSSSSSLTKSTTTNKRWFSLRRDFVLYSFRSETDDRALTALPLPGYAVTHGDQLKGDTSINEKDRDKIIKLFIRPTFAESAVRRVYLFAGNSVQDVERWASAMKMATRAENPP